MVKQLLSIPAFARTVGLSAAMARELVKRGKIPSVEVGRRRRINAHWVDKWLSTGNLPIGQPPAA